MTEEHISGWRRKKLPEAVSEFDEALWGSLMEYVTVSKDKTLVFTLLGGTEMKV